MLNLIRSECFKLARRPMAWLLLALLLALFVLLRGVEFLAVALTDGLLTGGEARVEILRPEQIAQFRLQLTFPGIFGAALSHVNGLGGLCAIVLAAGGLGSEYSWGTLRTQLARQPNRARYLLAKLAALLLTLLAGIGLVLALAALLGLLFSVLLGAGGGLGPGLLLALPLGALRALYVLLPYLLLTLAGCAIGRSVLAGAATGFLFLTLDVGLGALSFLAGLGGAVAWLISLVLQPNINTLVVLNSRSFGLDPAALTRSLDMATLPSPLQATLVIAAYSLLFGWYLWRAFARRDIAGAG